MANVKQENFYLVNDNNNNNNDNNYDNISVIKFWYIIYINVFYDDTTNTYIYLMFRN